MVVGGLKTTAQLASACIGTQACGRLALLAVCYLWVGWLGQILGQGSPSNQGAAARPFLTAEMLPAVSLPIF